jgi:hypothetical protein
MSGIKMFPVFGGQVFRSPVFGSHCMTFKYFLKVKELRNRADEGARNKMIHENEGIVYTVPLSGQHLEHLLNSIAILYNNNDLGLSLMLEYWCPTSGKN